MFRIIRVLYNNTVRPFICEGWYFTHTWNAFTWLLHFTKRDVLAHTTSLTLPLFIKVSVQSQESVRSCICVLGVSTLPFSTILIFDFRISTVWYFFVFHFIHNILVMFTMKNCNLCCWCLILLFLLFVNMVVFIGIYRLLQQLVSYIYRSPRQSEDDGNHYRDGCTVQWCHNRNVNCSWSIINPYQHISKTTSLKIYKLFEINSS